MKEPRKFKHWVYLNDEGKKLYGHIFLNGELPVVSMIPTTGLIEGEPERLYMIYHEELTIKQLEQLLNYIAERFNVDTKTVKNIVLSGKFEDRIPIREKYVSVAGTNHMGLFI